jgi:coenzyme F420-0:L-glutamate ligase / coenzyme F420-1:gamma-L-glutamate ligase
MAEEALTGAAAAFVAARPVGRLATADAQGRPHVVPVCYAWDGVTSTGLSGSTPPSGPPSTIWIALDAKPKRVADVTRLRRVRNIMARPQVALVVDDYLAAWDQLAYVLIEGMARLVHTHDPAHAGAVVALRAKYPQYAAMPIEEQPAIAIQPTHVVVWGAVEQRADRPALLEAAIPGRRVVRRFAPAAVTREQIERVLDAARWAPSPHGRQPWRFAVITRQGTKDQLAAAMGDEWRATLAQDGEPAEVVDQRLAQSHERIRSAPAIVVPCLYLEDLDRYADAGRQLAETTMAIQSLGAAIQNMLLAAYHAGLDMGWMCAPLFCQQLVQRALALPETWLPHALLPVGYAAAPPRRRPHRPANELTRWDS